MGGRSAASYVEKALSVGLPDMALHNCHTPGVSSIVLDATPHVDGVKMRRVFIARQGRHNLNQLVDWNTGQFVVGVHNHRYDLRIDPLVGYFTNYMITLDQSNDPWHEKIYEFGYTSDIKGDMSLTAPRERRIHAESDIVYVPGQHIMMFAEELHTVVLPDVTPITAWMVTEYADRIDSLFYSFVEDPQIDTTDLYLPMSVDDAVRELETLLEEM